MLLQKKAQEYKNIGNQNFKSGNYEEAIQNYNKAIELCPKTNSNDLSTFFQNRAAAYEQLVRRRVCVVGLLLFIIVLLNRSSMLMLEMIAPKHLS
jgi:tetratricopeptide (TPR) repeat protein